VTFATEVGDVSRFESPRQLMGYLGLVPGERSSGETVRRGGITKAGNGRVRHMLVESAWTYRHPPRVGKTKLTSYSKNCGRAQRTANFRKMDRLWFRRLDILISVGIS
jgi:transposase